MSRSGQEALTDVRKWSGGTPGCPEVVGGPPKCLRVVERHSWMFAIGREALPDLRVWSGGPSGSPDVVRRPSRMSAIGPGGPSGCPGVVGRPSWISGSGREALPDVRDMLGGPPE